MPASRKLASLHLALLVLLGSLGLTMATTASAHLDSNEPHTPHTGPGPDPMALSPAVLEERRDARASRSALRGTGGGGIELTPDPLVKDAYCVKQCVSPREATPGAIVRITGAYMDPVTRVVFPGKEGKMRVKYRAKSMTAVRVEVPRGADDGRPYVVTAAGAKSNRAPKELKIVSRAKIPKEVFPVRGPFSYGGKGSRFGAGRTGHIHQGQDMSASCGTRLVAIKKAKVVYNQYDDGGGNYIVLANKGENTSFVYMHLKRPAKPDVGEIVAAGEPIGRVGTTGSSSGCHLHFEYWIGPWQTGGKPIDPLPYLKSL